MEVVFSWVSDLEVSSLCFFMISPLCTSFRLLVSEAIIPDRAKVHNFIGLLTNWYALPRIFIAYLDSVHDLQMFDKIFIPLSLTELSK